MSNEQTCKTLLEDLRKDALAHYEEASSAISHWSSFVRDAIKAYNPAPPLPVQSDSGVEEVLRAIHQNTQGPRYWPPIKLALDEYASLKTKELGEKINQLMESAKEATEFRDELETEIDRLKAELLTYNL